MLAIIGVADLTRVATDLAAMFDKRGLMKFLRSPRGHRFVFDNVKSAPA
jgi:hypothetical protein